MKIKSVSVSGFKNVFQTKIELNAITVLISPNNYGKTNLLKAIDFGFDFIQSNAKQRNDLMHWVNGIPLNKRIENEDFIFEIEFESNNLKYKYMKYGYSFKWYKDDQSGSTITDEWLDTRDNLSVKYSSLIKRKDNKYKKSKDRASQRSKKLGHNQLFLDYLQMDSDIDYIDILKEIIEPNNKFYYSIDTEDAFTGVSLEYIGNSESSISFDNNKDIPKALYNLQETDKENFILFKDCVYNLFPEFEEFHVDTTSFKDKFLITNQELPFKLKDEVFRILIKCNNLNQPISIEKMSAGTRRIFWLLANILIASKKTNSIIAIEEIETSIHPRLIKKLLELIYENLNDSSLLLTSHSPYLIQYLKPNNLLISVPNEDGIAMFKAIKKTKVKRLREAASDFGLSTGEFIFDLLSSDNEKAHRIKDFLED